MKALTTVLMNGHTVTTEKRETYGLTGLAIARLAARRGVTVTRVTIDVAQRDQVTVATDATTTQAEADTLADLLAAGLAVGFWRVEVTNPGGDVLASRSWFADDTDCWCGQARGACPGCDFGGLCPTEVHNALSRYEAVYVCSDCGLAEALADWPGELSR